MEISFLRMPSTSRTLLLSALFSLTSALPWSGPGPTASYRPADWVPRPTSVPQSAPELLKRDGGNANASICGWIGGNANQPAACASNEKCVYDTSHGMVGCCPLSGACTVGVYTTCVQTALTELNPSVLTCTGGSACYENSYPGGYSQYGCGSPTDGQYVATTYSGQSWNFQLQILYTQLSLATSLSANPTSSTPSNLPSTTITITSSSPSAPSSATSSSASASSTSSSLPVGVQSVASAASSTVAATGQSAQAQAGIIAGSVVGGIGVIFAILALGCGLMRRRQRKKTEERRRLRSIATKEKSLSVSSYASSQISDRAGFHASSQTSEGTRFHPFSPDDIVSPTNDIVSPMSPFIQPTMASLQATMLVEAQHEVSHYPVPQHASPQYPSSHQVTPQQATPKQVTPQQDVSQQEVPQQEIEQPVESEAPYIRRVQLFDGPSIDELADLPPPWVRPPTPPTRSPKRLTIIRQAPQPEEPAPQIESLGDITPLEVYLKSQNTPLHPSASVSSHTTDTSRYSRTTDGHSVLGASIHSGWREERAPPMPKMSIVRKPVGSGWYRTMAQPVVEKKKLGDHVAFQLAGDSRLSTGRSLTPPQQTRERSFSAPPPIAVTGDMLGLYSEIGIDLDDGRGFDEMDSASDRVAPLRLSVSHRPSGVKKRRDTPVPILGVPAAPPPGGRGSRLYEVQ